MPNGGSHNCANCKYLLDTQCTLRDVKIDVPYWTTCRNWNSSDSVITDVKYAIVGEVINGVIRYGEIPYYNGKRPDTVQQPDGDTQVILRLNNQNTLLFGTVKEYLEFFNNAQD